MASIKCSDCGTEVGFASSESQDFAACLCEICARKNYLPPVLPGREPPVAPTNPNDPN